MRVAGHGGGAREAGSRAVVAADEVDAAGDAGGAGGECVQLVLRHQVVDDGTGGE
ncbi:hypothetical protein ACQ86N_22110 [Puia sp. P3]|uniref:hypothetical protein n=1 Tax=Puia sp. P3 TaxID=3423952 RepID=UPI003D66A898